MSSSHDGRSSITPTTLAAGEHAGRAGQQIRKGERVGIFYASANFDEGVFEDPFTFNIQRDPNPHVAFGGHGAHYCIGSNLARMEIWMIFNPLVDHAPGIQVLDEPKRLRHRWVNGIKDLQVRYAQEVR